MGKLDAQEQLQQLQDKATALRLDILNAVAAAGKGHLGGAFSCVEILVSLFYGGVMTPPVLNGGAPLRDRFILSKGHAGVCLYSVLADLDYFSKADLHRICQDGSFLGEHPDYKVPGVEINTGSLGQGLAIAAGIALASQLDGESHQAFVVLGDGECQEGSIWEAANFAANQKLQNLVAIVDRNNQMTLDYTTEGYGSDKLEDQWQAFGWEVISVDGHSIEQLLAAVSRPKSGRPRAIIANTVKGKGVCFMEGQLKWHHGMPSPEEFDLARKELGNGVAQA